MKNISLFPRVLIVLLLSVSVAVPQQDDAAPSPSPATTSATVQQPGPTPSPSPTLTPRVITLLGNVELDDIIEFRVQNLEEWVNQNTETNDPLKLVPYINGRAIRGNYPDELHLERGRLIYHLQIQPQNREVWIDLLGAPAGVKRPVTVSVGLENGSAFDSVQRKPGSVNCNLPCLWPGGGTFDSGHPRAAIMAGPQDEHYS
jgi:hypothetical protein